MVTESQCQGSVASPS